MTANELLASTLHTSMTMLTMSLVDLSDADLLQRPVPAANHPNWQLGHLFAVEKRMFALANDGVAMPEGFDARYTKQTATIDDPGSFLTKEQLLAIGEKLRASTIAWLKNATDQQLSAPAPENMRRLAATMADLFALQANHTSMHTGQIQVLRRKLGKPVLF